MANKTEREERLVYLMYLTNAVIIFISSVHQTGAKPHQNVISSQVRNAVHRDVELIH